MSLTKQLKKGDTMSNINLKLSVSIPDEIYEKFLTELERDGFVFATFGEYTLTLSMPDIEPIQTPDDSKMSRDELDKRDAFYKSLNFVHGGTGRRQGSTKEQTEEHAGSSPAHPIKNGMTLCKCGHNIGQVNAMWYHMDKIDEEDERAEFFGHRINMCMGFGETRKYQKHCYTCDCITPTPAEV
jgi:hypothetical protein